MAKDARDTDTADFIGLPGKRGRRPSPEAKTGAERQAAYRLRKAAQAVRPTHLVAELKQRIAGLERENGLLVYERAAAWKALDDLKRENELLRRTLAIGRN